jgi:hypothetical protein
MDDIKEILKNENPSLEDLVNCLEQVRTSGVEIVLHASALVELSILLRNEPDYPERYQVSASFYSLSAFMAFFCF